MAEVLPGLFLKDQYETAILEDSRVCCALIREILHLVETQAAAETRILIGRCQADPGTPLFAQSDKAGEEILALQETLRRRLNTILKQKALVWKILAAYIPGTLVKRIGKKQIMDIVNTDDMQEYRDAIITKKLSSTAFYRFGLEWESFTKKLEKDFAGTVAQLAAAFGGHQSM